MSYPPPPMYVQTARVSPEALHFTLRPRARAPIPPPAIELQGRVTAEDWFNKMSGIRTMLQTWEWSMLERIWLVVGILALVVVVSTAFRCPRSGRMRGAGRAR